MKRFSNLLIVGGTGRNTGKTELVCRIISRIALKRRIFGAKTSEIVPETGRNIGTTASVDIGYGIYEETNRISGKDTARMLKAGAHKVFYLQCNDGNVAEGFLELLKAIPEDMPLVCESNTLADYLKPGMFLVVTQEETQDRKLQDRLDKADSIIFSDGCSGFKEVDEIQYSVDGWYIGPA